MIDGETKEEIEKSTVISISDFISIFGNRKLFTHKNMKSYENIHNTDIKLFVPKLDDYLVKYNINTNIRVSHFFGQIEHESVRLTTTTEFADGSAYENREDLGNVNKGDGKRFKGRGLIQLTGMTNYKAFSDFYNLNKVDVKDFTIEPNNLLLAIDLDIAIQVSCWYWQPFKGLNQFADEDDLIYITYRVNGGFNGYNDRKEKTIRSINVLNVEVGEDFDKVLGEYDFITSRLYNNYAGVYMWAKYHDKFYKDLKGTDKNDDIARAAYERVIFMFDNELVRKGKNNLKIYNNAKIRLSAL